LFGFLPAVILFCRAILNLLGPDPLKALEHELGEYALIFLIFLLLFSPIKKFFDLNLMKFRRSIGLLAFWYVLLHFLTYLLLDQQLIWELIFKDLLKRPYIIFGFFGFLALIPLALTSNRWSVRYFGFGNWKRIHLLVYPATFLGVSHYLMIVKSWPIKPLLYFLLVVLLLIFRFGFKKYYQDKKI
jgi:sulfoxide reductase heme-binding subunit YedZ